MSHATCPLVLATGLLDAMAATLRTGSTALVSSVIGLATGLVGAALAAALGRSSELLLGRAVEAMGAFPPVILVTLVGAMFPQAGVWSVVLALGFFRAVEVALVLQAEARRLERTGFVHASVALGASRGQVLRRHMTPFVAPAALIAMSSGLTTSIVVELSLASLDLGGVTGGLGLTLIKAVQDGDTPGIILVSACVVVTLVTGYLLTERVRERLDPTRYQDGPFRRGGIVLWSRPWPSRSSTNETSRPRCCAASCPS